VVVGPGFERMEFIIKKNSSLFSLGPSRTNAPFARGTRVFKFPCICGFSGELVVHTAISRKVVGKSARDNPER